MAELRRRQRQRGRLVGWVAFGLVALTTSALLAAYLVNMVQWRHTPDRGWIYFHEIGPHVVYQTRPLGEQAGLRTGDRILRINGARYSTFDEMNARIDYEIGATNEYEVQRGEEILSVSVTTRPLGLGQVARQSGVVWLVGALFVGLGLLVFGMKPFAGASWAFLSATAAMGVAIAYSASMAPYRPSWLQNVVLLAIPVVPAGVLHLTAFFPQRRRWVVERPWLLVLAYGLSAALALGWILPGDLAAPVVGRVRMAIYIYLAAAVLAFLLSTVTLWQQSRSAAVRLQALVVVTGLAVAFFPPTAELVSNVLFQISLFPQPVLFYLAFFLFFPATIGYAIVQHDLFEIDTIVRRTYGYLLSTAAVLALYGTTVSTLNFVVGPSALLESPLFAVAFVMAMVFVMQPVHGRIQALVDRIFYRQRYDYRATITSLTERITALLDPRAVRETLVGSLVGEMFLENGMLLAPADGAESLELHVDVGKSWAEGRPLEVRVAEPVARTIVARQGPLFRHEVELDPAFEAHRGVMAATFDALEAEMLMPMFYQGKLRAVLSLGRKKSGKMFNREDVDLLKTLGFEAAIALENSRLFKELADSLKQVQLLETVKSNLAKFVPETVKTMVEDAEDAEALFQKRDRDLTVMFADMTGYTRLSAQLPIEEVNHIIERYFGAFLDEILKHGGDVNETAGDGLMVLFQDDDPARHARAAVSAALGIQRITRQINAEREAEGGDPVGMHIGINSGTASVGATKISGGVGMRWTYTASGPVTNVAARIGALGEEVAITAATRERLGEGYRVEEIGPQPLKNVHEPVMVFRVLAGDIGAAVHHGTPDEEAAASERVGRDGVEERIWEEAHALGRGRFAIRGHVRAAEDEGPLPGLWVQAFDKDWVRDDDLGHAVTAPDGSFEILFTDEFFGDLFESRPDLYLVIRDRRDGSEIHHTRDAVRWNAEAVEHYECRIPRARLGASRASGTG